MTANDLDRVFRHLPGHHALLRAAPGFPIVAASRAFRARSVFGDAIEGRTCAEAFPENPAAPGADGPRIAALERVVRERAAVRHEQRCDLRDPVTGDWIEQHWLVEDTPIFGDDGAVDYILHHAESAAGAAARESAERERARLAFESDQRRRIYETALNSTPDFVYVFGLDHRAIYANDALLKVWGVDDVRGKNWLDLGYEQWHADKHDAELAQVIRTGKPIRGEIPFTGTNGRRIYDYIFAPVLDPDGRVVAVAGTTRDISDRQAAEQTLREHAERLAEADRAKDEFLATLSHELRNPLAPLRNGLQLLRLSTDADSRAATVHAMMERQVDHLVRLVDDLLEVSRITRGTLSLRDERVPLDAIVNAALETSRPLIAAGGHRLDVSLPPESPWLQGDRVRLAQILANLLNNAAKYSEPDGRVAVAARVDGRDVVIAVSDDGIGMEPQTIPRLFEMFTRGDRDSSYHQGGLGIGLALARRLATMHGGTIDATSDGPGRGSTFTVRLPMAAGPGDDDAAGPAVMPRLSLRILVADDNADVGGSLAETLALLGATVHVETSGPGAIDAFAGFAPDVAILDIGMPRVTGYDVARALRARGHRQPLIALTGWGQDADRDRALAAGFSHHLVKPVSLPTLLALLASVDTTVA